jgi:hypothetical protein
MGKITVKGFVTTTQPSSAYGGLQLHPQVIRTVAEALRNGHAPMNALHDQRRRLDPRILKVEVRDTDDGYQGVWVEFEVEEEEWDKQGDMRGFSPSLIQPYLKPLPDNENPSLRIAADAGHFGDRELEEAAAILASHFSVEAGRLYQLSELPDPRVIVEMTVTTLQTLASNISASALYDALKVFLRRGNRAKETTDFNFRITGEAGKPVVEGALRTSNDEHLKQVLDTLKELQRPGLEGKSLEFEPDSGKWKELN